MPKTYSVHVWDNDGIGREVSSFRSLRAAVSYAAREATNYDGGLYVCRPDGVVVIGDGQYMRDGRPCDNRGQTIKD